MKNCYLWVYLNQLCTTNSWVCDTFSRFTANVHYKNSQWGTADIVSIHNHNQKLCVKVILYIPFSCYSVMVTIKNTLLWIYAKGFSKFHGWMNACTSCKDHIRHSFIQRILTRSLWICTVTINVYVARAVGPLFAEDFLASPCYSLMYSLKHEWSSWFWLP